MPVTGVVAQAGVLDLRLASELALSRGVVHGSSAARRPRCPSATRPRRPPSGCRSACPALLTHGGRDEIVPPAMSERFAAAARAAGDDVELVVEPARTTSATSTRRTRCGAAVTAWLTR